MLNGGGINPDGLSLDLQFALDKTLTARRGPTPTFARASSGTFVNANKIIVGKTAGTTSSITPSTQAISSQVTVTVASGSVVGWVVGQAISLIVDTDGQDDPDATELWLLGDIVSSTDTTLVFTVTSRTAQAGSATSWTLGYRGPRFDHDPVTGACKGLLIEESRTNLVFPSETLTTQTRAVTAVPHTLSFYGTGTVVLSGAHSATVVGTGAYPTRTTLTFTPTAGSLTLTVTGSVTQAQLEAGSFPTSYIPTTINTLTRSADVCSIANTIPFWNSSEFTVFTNANFVTSGIDTYASNFNITSGFFGVRRNSSNVASAIIRSSGVNADINLGAFATGSMRTAVAHSTGQQAASLNGASAIQNNSAFVPSLNPLLNIGAGGVNVYLNGHVLAIRYYKKRLPNAKLVTLTT